jgi:protein RecA
MAKEKNAPEKGKALDIALKNFKGFAKKASSVRDTEFISTGDFYLDLAIAHGISPDDPNFNPAIHKSGGLPLGRVVELSGGEGCGKSSESYRVVRNAQLMGFKCLWIDAEHSFSPELAAIYGVDMEKLDVADLIDEDDPEHLYSAEEIFDRINNACDLGYKVIVLDSVANLMTGAETENDLADGGVGMGGVAGVLSKALKKTVNYAAKNGTLVILINQLREKIGQMFGNPEYTPGGRALRHNCSVRIKMMKQTKKDDTNSGKGGPIHLETEQGPVLIGNYSFVYILKNRHGKPVSGEIRIPMYYEPYFPEPDDIIFNEGMRLGIITKRLTVRKWVSADIKGEGKIGLIEAIRSAGRMEELVNEIKAKAKEEKAILPPEVLNYDPLLKQVEVREGKTDSE